MFAYMDLIFLGLVVALILYKLNTVLGTRPNKPFIKIVNKQEFDRLYNMLAQKAQENENFAAIKLVSSPIDAELEKINNFNKADFLKRASKVFEMVLQAFAAQDKETLKMLTTSKLGKKFNEVIDSRKAENITAESDLIKIDEMKIKNVKISEKGVAQITVEFISSQINVLKDATGTLIEGDENFVQKITDDWTFEKDIHSPSPVWLLSSTKKKQWKNTLLSFCLFYFSPALSKKNSLKTKILS